MKTKDIDSIMTIDDIRMENEEGKVVDFNFRLLSIAFNIVTQMSFLFLLGYFPLAESQDSCILTLILSLNETHGSAPEFHCCVG
jgi:hypothetical protein